MGAKLHELNAREEMLAAADWLGWQEESLSFGLRTAEDGLKLYRYAIAHPELPEMYDEDADGVNMARHRRAALGYDPLGSKEQRRVMAQHAKD